MLERFADYWNKGADPLRPRSSTCRSPTRPCASPTCKSGQLDFIERLAPSDVPAAARPTRASRSRKITEIGYQGITINVGKSDAGAEEPARPDPRVREAFELALDREGIVQVVMDGEATVGNQWVAPTNPFYAKNVPMPEARRRAGEGAAARKPACPTRRFTLMTPTTSDAQQIAQVVQAMAKRGRLRREDPVDRVRDLAEHGRQGRLRGLRAGVERPRRSRRQHLQLRRAASSRSTTPATASRRSTSCSTSRARRATSAERKKALRADRRASCSRTGRSSTSTTATGCGRTRQARRRARRCPTACVRVQGLKLQTCSAGARDAAMFDVPASGALAHDRPDAALRLDADLRAAAAAARRPGAGPRRRGARPERRRLPAREAAPRRAAAGALRCTGSAACCRATSASRCASQQPVLELIAARSCR